MRSSFTPFIAFFCAILAIMTILMYKPQYSHGVQQKPSLDLSEISPLFLHEKFTIDQYPAVLFFFTTWCNSCNNIQAQLTEFHQKNPHIKIYAISIAEAEQDVITKLNNFNYYHKAGIISQTGAKKMGLYKVPTLYLLLNSNKSYYIKDIDYIMKIINK